MQELDDMALGDEGLKLALGIHHGDAVNLPLHHELKGNQQGGGVFHGMEGIALGGA